MEPAWARKDKGLVNQHRDSTNKKSKWEELTKQWQWSRLKTSVVPFIGSCTTFMSWGLAYSINWESAFTHHHEELPNRFRHISILLNCIWVSRYHQQFYSGYFTGHSPWISCAQINKGLIPWYSNPHGSCFPWLQKLVILLHILNWGYWNCVMFRLSVDQEFVKKGKTAKPTVNPNKVHISTANHN
jgi:hypothetical protein